MTSDWTVTLTATMVGVFAGIYLNEYFSQSSLQRESGHAIEQIEQEIASNQEVIDTTYKTHNKYFPVFAFYFENADDNGDLVVRSAKMANFQRQYPATIVLSDSLLVEGDIYHYEGEVDMKFGAFAAVQLSDIAWQTLQNSRLSAGLSYDCLFYLAAIYRLQEHIKTENASFLNALAEASDANNPDKRKAFLRKWKLLLDLENSLAALYDSSSKEMKDCR